MGFALNQPGMGEDTFDTVYQAVQSYQTPTGSITDSIIGGVQNLIKSITSPDVVKAGMSKVMGVPVRTTAPSYTGAPQSDNTTLYLLGAAAVAVLLLSRR
jgi:hypothetical protein